MRAPLRPAAVVLALALALPGAARAVETIVQAPSPEVARLAARSVHGSIVDVIPQLSAYLIRTDGPALPRFDRAVGIEAAVVNSAQPLGPVGRPSFLPTDELLPYEWHLERLGAPSAWDETLGDPSVVIAILDSGVDATHPDLAGKVVLGPDVADGDDDPADGIGHGTAVAGAAGAAANGIGVVGVCPGCTLLVVKVVKDGSSSVTKFDSAKGIVWAADHGADVVNLSFGSETPDPVQQDAVRYAQDAGALVVAAAGNEPTTVPQYPAAYPGVLAVAGSTERNRLWAGSATGPWVDIAAPAVRVLTTAPEQSYTRGTGTSFSTPLVAGAAGLLRSRVPGLTAGQAAEAILTGSLPLAGTSIRRVDLPRALRRALGGPIEPDPPIVLTIDPLEVTAGKPGPGRLVRAVGKVVRSDTGERAVSGTVRCRARVGSARLEVVQATFRRGVVKCIWALPPRPAALTVHGSVRVSTLGSSRTRPFTFRTAVRRPAGLGYSP